MPTSTRYSRSADPTKPAPQKIVPPNMIRAKPARTKSSAKTCATTMHHHSGAASNSTLNEEIQHNDEVNLLFLESTLREAMPMPNAESSLNVVTTPPAEEVSDATCSIIITETTVSSPRASPVDICFENDDFEIVRDDEVNGVEYPINDDENALLDEDSFSSLAGSDLQPCPDPRDSSDDDADHVYAEAADLHLTIKQKIDLLLLLATKRRHNLSYSAAEDIMNLAGVLSEDKSGFLPTRHIMKKAIELYSACDLTEHHVCPHCGLYIGVITSSSFTCEDCQRNISTDINRKKGNMFICISLQKQLESIIRNCFKHIVDPTTRKKICQNNYEDIYDGKIYKGGVAHGELSFNFFVDGLQVASTSKQSAWPVLGCLNELPLPLRRKHVFMACIWLGLKKPKCQQYLKPFVQECNLLQEKGIQFKNGCHNFNFKVKALMCVSDTVARPLLRNSSQFNGENGCGLCYHPGVSMRYLKGHIRSYTLRQGEYPLRTHDEIMDMAVIAENEGKPRYGIVGKSVLSDISGFDIARCLDLDFFHALVNVSKRFAMLWFSRRLRKKPYSVYSKFQEVDERLLKITPTSDVSRAPRSLKERSDYRGHEWFHWVVEYSIPVLKNVLSAKFLNHWSLLVHAVALVMQNSLSKSELGYASRYLVKFVTEIDQLYGPQHVTISVHLLTHLGDSVRNFGQPWTHSAFVFESFNHDIKQFVKSSNGVAQQICKGIQMRVALKNLEECVKDDMTLSQKDFLQKLKTSSHSLVSPNLVIGGAALLGKPKAINLTPTTIRFLQTGGVDCELRSAISVYDRCIIDGELYHSTNYSRDTRQCNNIILLETGEVLNVDYFLVAQDCFVVGKCFNKNRTVKLCTQALPHILVLNAEPEPELKCFPASMVQSKLLSFKLDLSNNLLVRIACINVLQSEMLT